MKNSKYPRPPLKWTGGKQRILTTLLPHISAPGRLIEPFVGAGAVFMAAGERDILINDANSSLIEFYLCLKADVKGFLEVAERLFCESNRNAEAYARNRDLFNNGSTGVERAALFLYLNKFGFNGLYRVNKRGAFNVPYGHHAMLPGFPRQQLLDMSAKLQRVEILQGEFMAAMALAASGDVVYCDPPYLDTATTKSSFTAYTAAAFGPQQHRELVAAAHAAVARGATVVISNHDSEVSRNLYVGAEIHSFEVRRSVAANGGARIAVRELIAVFRPSASLVPLVGSSNRELEQHVAAENTITETKNDTGEVMAYLDIFELAMLLDFSLIKIRRLLNETPWLLPSPASFGSLNILRWRLHEVERWAIENAVTL